MTQRFMTEVELPAGQRGRILHGEKLWTLGSCFADEIGGRMERELFDVEVNPFGPLYNPLSILAAIRRVAGNIPVEESELFEHGGLYHSFDFHSRFSSTGREKLARDLSAIINRLHGQLKDLKAVTLTLGSARGFELCDSGRIVANCHKLPASRFNPVDIPIEAIERAVSEIYATLRGFSPDVMLVVTVSPIRHKAYGYHADRVGKSRLLVAVDNFIRSVSPQGGTIPGIVYFPAYEIMDDELRDYRFYAADMIHPSEVAADYIYQRFGETFFSDDTFSLCREARSLTSRLLHRPLNASTAHATRAAAKEASDTFAKLHPALSQALGRFVSKCYEE